MGITIENLNAAASAQSGHVFPAMLDGETVKLSAGQLATLIIAMVTDSAPETLDTLNELAAALGDDPNFSTTVLTAIGLKANATDLDDPYRFVPMGGLVYNLGITGWVAPDKGSSLYRYALLTAGETGGGDYNEGILTSESVTGSAPLVQATAVISLSGSPFNGETIHLLNTEGRFIRAGETGGVVQNDAFQGHIFGDPDQPAYDNLGQFNERLPSGSANADYAHIVATKVDTDSTSAGQLARLSPTTDGSNGTPRFGTETRSKNISAVAYMRIK